MAQASPAPRVLPFPSRETRDKLILRGKTLFTERTGSGYDARWREIGEYLVPDRPRLLYRSKEEGRKLNQKIINDTATWALGTFVGGMSTWTASPARPWFKFVAADPDLNDYDPVRVWFDDADKVVRRILARSNFYDCVPQVYENLGTWGTAAQFRTEDFKDVMRFYVWPVGSYAVALGSRLTVDTIFHEGRMKVGQIAERFGLDNASPTVKAAAERQAWDTEIKVCHGIYPNADYSPERADARGKEWVSVYYEADYRGDEPPLGIGNGFRTFPCAVPRWEVTGEDAYGRSPAMKCIGDVRALQHLEKVDGMLLDRGANPPMNFPASMKESGATLLPGNANWIPDMAQTEAKPSFYPDARFVQFTEAKIREHEFRVKRAFYVDLFMALAQTNDTQKTAKEITLRHEEAMLQLGSALNKVNNEYLKPCVLDTLTEAMRRGMLPPMPPELKALGLPAVESISLLEQAQKLLATAASERAVAYLGSLVSVYPEASDNLNVDENFRDYTELVGLPADNINPQDVVAAKRKQRQQQAQAQAAAQMAKPASDAATAAQTLSNTDLRGDDTLNRIVGAIVPGVQ